MTGIKDPDALELFRRYAFEAVPEDAKKEVESKLVGEVEKIVKLCNGLPLSLEVLGKYLGNSGSYKDLEGWKEIWAEAYARLQKARNLDGDKLWNSLQISYDGLGDLEEKMMFLDFACIFSEIKMEKRVVERIWGSSIGVQNLINKSLLKKSDQVVTKSLLIEGCEYFVMHDQLRDMGRHLLLKDALKDNPIYLMQGEEGLSEPYTKFKKRITESGVPYIASLEQEDVTSSRQYSKLRLLRVIGCDTPSLVDACLSQCSGDLRWLYLKKCKGVTKIGIEHLCSFGGLRVLNIYDCDKIVELPEDIDKLKDLVEIEVVGCSNLQSLPNTVSKLKNLRRLVIASCKKLQAVPDSLGELSRMEFLSFKGCKKLMENCGTQICTQICTLNLMTLKLPYVPKICPGRWPKLQELHMYGRSLAEFPQDLLRVDMPKLKVVYWDSNSSDSSRLVIKNPDSSEVVLKNNTYYNVRRDDTGSISGLFEAEESRKWFSADRQRSSAHRECSADRGCSSAELERLNLMCADRPRSGVVLTVSGLVLTVYR